MAVRFTATPDEPLQVRFDPDERLALISPTVKLKGMFMAKVVEIVGPGWQSTPGLLAPPRLGTYLPFIDYPLVDYLRLSLVAAKKRHPRVPLSEALRLLERSMLSAFTDSAVGRVMMGML